MLHGHEGAVVLGKIDLRVGDALLRKAVGKPLRESLGYLIERSIEYGGVFALDQAHGADLAGNGDVDVLAHHLAADFRRTPLMVRPHRGKDAGNGDGVHDSLELCKEITRSRLVQRRELFAVIFKAAADDRALFADETDILRPVHHRRHAHGRRSADAQKPDLRQVFALDDGVGALRRTQHRLADLAAVHLRLLQQFLHRAHDALENISRSGILDLADDLADLRR